MVSMVKGTSPGLGCKSELTKRAFETANCTVVMVTRQMSKKDVVNICVIEKGESVV